MTLRKQALGYIINKTNNWNVKGCLMDKPIVSQKIRVERKQFFFDLKENASGRFVRITEDVFGRRDTIIVPTSGLGDFLEALHYFAQELEAIGETIAPTSPEAIVDEPAEIPYEPQPAYYANPIGAGRGR